MIAKVLSRIHTFQKWSEVESVRRTLVTGEVYLLFPSLILLDCKNICCGLPYCILVNLSSMNAWSNPNCCKRCCRPWCLVRRPQIRGPPYNKPPSFVDCDWYCFIWSFDLMFFFWCFNVMFLHLEEWMAISYLLSLWYSEITGTPLLSLWCLIQSEQFWLI